MQGCRLLPQIFRPSYGPETCSSTAAQHAQCSWVETGSRQNSDGAYYLISIMQVWFHDIFHYIFTWMFATIVKGKNRRGTNATYVGSQRFLSILVFLLQSRTFGSKYLYFLNFVTCNTYRQNSELILTHSGCLCYVDRQFLQNNFAASIPRLQTH